jgi:1,4-alpha-glucan branching enzyme
MIYMGQEFAESAAKTIGWQRLDWSLLQNESNADLMRFYTGLIKLRTSNRALQSNTYETICNDGERGIFGFKRWEESGGVVAVIANLKNQYAGEFSVGNLPDGKWHEYIYNYDVEVQGGVLRDTLAESEVKVYLKTA